MRHKIKPEQHKLFCMNQNSVTLTSLKRLVTWRQNTQTTVAGVLCVFRKDMELTAPDGRTVFQEDSSWVRGNIREASPRVTLIWRSKFTQRLGCWALVPLSQHLTDNQCSVLWSHYAQKLFYQEGDNPTEVNHTEKFHTNKLMWCMIVRC